MLKTHILQFRVQMFQSRYSTCRSNWTGTDEFFSGSHPRTRWRHGSEKSFLFRIFIIMYFYVLRDTICIRETRYCGLSSNSLSHLPSEITLVGLAATLYSTWGKSDLSRLGVALLETLVCRSSRSASKRVK